MRRTHILSTLSILLLLVSPLRGQVISGLDVLKRDEFAQLHVRRVGLITNQTGIDLKGRRSIDILYGAPKVKLVAIWEELSTAENSKLGSRMEHGVAKDLKYALPKLLDQSG